MNFEKLWVIASDVYRKTVKSPSFLIGVFMPFIVAVSYTHLTLPTN